MIEIQSLWEELPLDYPVPGAIMSNPVQSGQTSLATLVLSAENVERKVLVLLR
jgi:hypothetical protein